jgi:uncharacterized membrane-anchored protein
MSDSVVILGSSAGLIALIAGIVWFAWLRGEHKTLAGINAVIALAIMIVFARHLDAAIRYREVSSLVLFAIEASIVLTFALLLAGKRVPNFVVVVLAAINLLIVGGTLFFLLAFRFTRLL